jgi:hypothetical protein
VIDQDDETGPTTRRPRRSSDAEQLTNVSLLLHGLAVDTGQAAERLDQLEGAERDAVRALLENRTRAVADALHELGAVFKR